MNIKEQAHLSFSTILRYKEELMLHVITKKTKPIHSKSGLFCVHQIPSAQDNVIWLIEWKERDEKFAIVVDGPCATEVLQFCTEKDIELRAILNTHTHGDHVGINHDLRKKKMLDGVLVYGHKSVQKDIPGITYPVQNNDIISIGPIQIKVLLTEGHIDGHVSYLIDEFLFCGDTMFGAGCGYLFDGPPSKMHNSLQVFSTMPENTYVCCGHEYTEDNLKFAWTQEPENVHLQKRIVEVLHKRRRGESTLPSTIGIEKRTNPFVRSNTTVAFAKKRKSKDGGEYRNIQWPPSFIHTL